MQNHKVDWWWPVMRSEIPQLDVITAIADSESEDYVSQLLFSQGWNIIYRAFDARSLKEFLDLREPTLRTVVIYRSDLEGFDSGMIDTGPTSSTTFISLDDVRTNSHAIMVRIRQELRAPLITTREPSSEPSYPVRPRDYQSAASQTQTHDFSRPYNQRDIRQEREVRQDRDIHSAPRSFITKQRRIIAVTGSAGAPGRTRFALAIAQEIARTEQVLLVDADLRSQTLARQRDRLSSSLIHIAPLDPKQRPTALPTGERTTIVDLGTLPALSEAVTDRRWQGSLVNNVLDSATHLVYLTKSTPSSIDELSHFLREFPVLLKALPITYLCILSGHSRALREWEAKFMSLTIGENRHILRESQLDPAPESALLPFLKATNPNRKEIGKILASLL